MLRVIHVDTEVLQAMQDFVLNHISNPGNPKALQPPLNPD